MAKNRLIYRNNWEQDEYYIKDKRIRDIKSVEINGRQYPVRKRIVGVEVSDHGHRYIANSDHFFIYLTIDDSVEFERDLNELCDDYKVYFLE